MLSGDGTLKQLLLVIEFVHLFSVKRGLCWFAVNIYMPFTVHAVNSSLAVNFHAEVKDHISGYLLLYYSL